MADTTGPGYFVWHDLMTKDAAKGQEFYTELLGWQIVDTDVHGFTYHMAHSGAGPIGGIVQEDSVPVSHWIPYVAVEDVKQGGERAVELGGEVCVPPTDIPAGTFSVVTDPGGAALCLYKAAGADTVGAGVADATPGRVCWNELWTPEPQKVLPFYRDMFGWQTDETDMGEAGIYYVQKKDDVQVAGVMAAQGDETKPYWCPYFLVERLDEAAAKATELGASLCVPPRDIPDVGRFSVHADPTGAVFSLFSGPV